MTNSPAETLWSYFDALEDPRKHNHNKRHELKDILVLVILAVICGAESWVDIEDFGHAKADWLKRFLKLPHGIPSHDTLGRVFSLLNPKQLQTCFLAWTQSLVKISDGEVIALDGKTLRRSHDRSQNHPAIHMVSAWASTNRVVLGQVKTNEKSNEITALPLLLEALSLKGCTVTIDAMGCQKDIARQIVAQGGDYVLALKGNQGSLQEDVQLYLEQQLNQATTMLLYHETVDKDHGRIEVRRYWQTDQIGWLVQKRDWQGLQSIGVVEAERHVNGKVTRERRFYISSRAVDVVGFAQAVRQHWGIENSVHWCLDMAFDEDQCRIRIGHAAENLAVIRHIALNMLRQETSAKVGLKAKRKKAGWDERYLTKVLLASGF